MNSYIYSDLYRCEGKTSKLSLLKRLWRDPCYRFLYCFRKTQRLSLFNPLGLIFRFLYSSLSVKYGIQIPKCVKVGRGFVILHYGGIVINSKTTIGNNCTLLQNVTLGNTKRGKMKGAPTIGNNVFIGPGAVVVGRVNIGDNVLIAPNAYVNFNVPGNSVVIGNPATILSNNHATEGYILNTDY